MRLKLEKKREDGLGSEEVVVNLVMQVRSSAMEAMSFGCERERERERE